MASKLPRYIMRNWALFADRVQKLGQGSEVTIPVPARKMAEVYNAGMIKPRDVELGFEKLELVFKMTAVLDPQAMKLFALRGERDYMVTGALVDEDGTIHSAVCFMRGTMSKRDGGAWKTGELAEDEYLVSVNYMKLEVDGEVLIEMDDFEVSVGGESQTGGIASALLV